MNSGGGIIGRPLSAVLVPRQAARFASLTGADLNALVVNVTGWTKLVLLDPDRAFLFPRTAEDVEWFERELIVYQELAVTRLTVVPRLLGRWADQEIYPFPFAAVTRLRGEPPEQPEALLEQLGRATAGWHELEVPLLPEARAQRHLAADHQRWFDRALQPATSAEAVAEAAGRLGLPGRAAMWTDLLGRAARLAPVMVHGDIHEDQLLAENGRLTGILDWATARVDHPFRDFDLGEWGTGPWRRLRGDFSALWARWWRAYAELRGLDTDSRPLETALRLRHALWLLTEPGDPAVAGTISEQLAHL